MLRLMAWFCIEKSKSKCWTHIVISADVVQWEEEPDHPNGERILHFDKEFRPLREAIRTYDGVRPCALSKRSLHGGGE